MSNALVHLARQAAGMGPLTITSKQKYGALAIAGLVDVLQATVLMPSTIAGPASPLEWGIDIGTALALTLVLGWNWRLLVAFLVELLPTVGMFPTWSTMILTITAMSTEKKVAAAAPVTGPVGGPSPGLDVHPLPGSPGLPLPPPGAPVPPPAAGERFPGVYQKRSR